MGRTRSSRRHPRRLALPAAFAATELVQRLALGAALPRETGGTAEEARARMDVLKATLRAHLDGEYTRSGRYRNGWDGAESGAAFLLPAVLALRTAGDLDLEEALARVHSWRGLAFATALTRSPLTGRSLRLQLANDSPEAGDAGWASLLFGVVPGTDLAAYRAFYDLHLGPRSGRSVEERFDPEGVGQVWAMLFYPEDVPAEAPERRFGHAFEDEESGAFFFRSGWRDRDDIQVGLLGDVRGLGTKMKAHTFGLAIRALGVSFAGGPGATRAGRQMSTLLVDGRAHRGRFRPATVIAYESWKAGGYVAIDAGDKFADAGLSSARRHLLVDLAGAQGQGLFATLDEVRAPAAHAFSFQLNPGDHVGSDGITTSSVVESGRATFTMRARDGGYLKGWVLSPAAVDVATGDPLRVTARGRDVDLWIVMVAGRGEPPAAQVTGSGRDGTIHVGGRRVWIEGDRMKTAFFTP